MTDEGRRASSYRWVLLASLWGLYVGFGFVSRSLAPLIGTITDDLGLSRAQMGTILGAWQLVYLFSAVPAGRLLGRIGLRWGMTIGIVLIIASGVARSAATGWGSLFAAVAVFGLGGPMISIGAPALVSGWFTGNERGPATGVAVSGPVIGAVLSLSLSNSVLMPLTGERWRAVVLIHAAGAAVAAVIWLVVTARPPTDAALPWHGGPHGEVAEAGSRHAGSKSGGPRAPSVAGSRELLRVPMVRLVLVLAIGTFFVNHAMGNWLPEMLRASGLTAAQAGAWAALPNLLGLAGGIIVPRLAVEQRRRLVLAVCYVTMALGILALRGDWSLLSALGLIGIGIMRSAVLPVAMVFLMDSPDVGPRNMAPAGGLYFTAGEIGGVTGPLAVGVLATSAGFGSAQLVLALVAGALAVFVASSRSLRGAGQPPPGSNVQVGPA